MISKLLVYTTTVDLSTIKEGSVSDTWLDLENNAVLQNPKKSRWSVLFWRKKTNPPKPDKKRMATHSLDESTLNSVIMDYSQNNPAASTMKDSSPLQDNDPKKELQDTKEMKTNEEKSKEGDDKKQKEGTDQVKENNSKEEDDKKEKEEKSKEGTEKTELKEEKSKEETKKTEPKENNSKEEGDKKEKEKKSKEKIDKKEKKNKKEKKSKEGTEKTESKEKNSKEEDDKKEKEQKERSNTSDKVETTKLVGDDPNYTKETIVDFGLPTLHIRIYNGVKLEETDDTCLFFYKEILDQFQTGDCIAFSGRSPLAKIITSGTATPYSHLGTILRMPDPKQPDKEDVFIMESTQNAWDVPDYLTGEVRRGVTLFKFSERLHRIDSVAAWHIPLKNPLTKDEQKKYIETCLEYHTKEIKYDKIQLITFILGVNNQENLSELFCSEFVAAALRSVSRLPQDFNPSAMTPSHVVHSDSFTAKGPTIKLNMIRFQVHCPLLAV